MTVKEIRQQGNFLYSKSAQHIVNAFIIVGTITTFAQLYASTWIGLLITLFIAPIELGLYRALLKAYDRQGKDVKTKEYIMMGLKEYKQYASIFIGKILYIWLVEALIVIVGMLVFSRSSLNMIPTALHAVWAGNTSILLGNVDVTTAMQALSNGTFESGITIATLIFTVIAEFVGFVMGLYYALTFFYAVDQGRDIGDSLRDSRYAMMGNIWNYIKLMLGYAPHYILSLIIVAVVNSSLTNLAIMMAGYVPDLFKIVIFIAFNLLMSLVTALVAIILYQVKMQLSVTVFYKELEKSDI